MMRPPIIKTFRLSKFTIHLLPSSHLKKRLFIPSAKKVEKNIPMVSVRRKKKEAPITKIQPKKEQTNIASIGEGERQQGITVSPSDFPDFKSEETSD
jgi:hypothetical protein